MSRFLVSSAFCVLLLTGAPPSRLLAEFTSNFEVQAVEADGRVSERWYTETYAEAQGIVVRRRLDTTDTRPYRIVRLANRKATRPTIGKKIAESVTKIDETLRTTRKIATASGIKVPSTGQVLGEYRKSVEMAYSNASALGKGLKEFQKSGTEKVFAEANKLLNDRIEMEPDLFLQKTKLDLTKTVVDQSAADATSKQRQTKSVVDEIAKTKDPQQREGLLKKLDGLRESGELRDGAVAEANSQTAKAEYSATAKNIDDLQKRLDENQKSLDENGKLMLQIVNDAFKPHWIVGTTWGIAAQEFHPRFDRWTNHGEGIITFQENGKGKLLVGNDDGSETRKEFTWSAGKESITVNGFHFGFGADRGIQFKISEGDQQAETTATSKYDVGARAMISCRWRIDKDWGLRRLNPGVAVRCYQWILVPPGDDEIRFKSALP